MVGADARLDEIPATMPLLSLSVAPRRLLAGAVRLALLGAATASSAAAQKRPPMEFTRQGLLILNFAAGARRRRRSSGAARATGCATASRIS